MIRWQHKVKYLRLEKIGNTLPEGNLKDRLEYDYNNWPIDAGAPWDDVNEDGVFTPGFDKPKFIGDETLFYVANDLDTATTRYTYGSDPMGLEFQTTVFGFNRDDLKDVVFQESIKLLIKVKQILPICILITGRMMIWVMQMMTLSVVIPL